MAPRQWLCLHIIAVFKILVQIKNSPALDCTDVFFFLQGKVRVKGSNIRKSERN